MSLSAETFAIVWRHPPAPDATALAAGLRPVMAEPGRGLEADRAGHREEGSKRRALGRLGPGRGEGES